MTNERWQQIEQLYHEALERDPGERAAFVAEACAGDESLRKEVESLLARDASSPDILLNRMAVPTSTITRLAPGMRLGPYELESPLGSGGMGEVWKARDTRLGRTVAVKIAKTEFSARFEREARAVAALNHPHIATLYDVGPNYFVMEYVDGQSLQQLIPRKGLPLGQVLGYATQIADALAAAHAAGIVHRDLKPGNIMIASDGRVKVVDFGLARVAGLEQRRSGDPASLQTAEGTIAGTVSYMSPEQAQGRNVDARSDIFSFGAVLYEMLTGARAFHGDTPMSTLADIIHKDPRPVGEIAGNLPRDVETLLNRCLRKDPARRAQSMADVKVALQDLKEDSESGRLNVGPPGLRKRRISTIWLAAGMTMLLLAAAMGWYFVRSQSSSGQVMFNAVPLTSYPGEQIQPSFSPDGNQVAFAWNGPHRDNWDIYVKVVGEGDPLRLTSDPADEVSPAWSPDGRWIAFVRELPGNRYALMLISPLGGAARKVGEFGAPEVNSAILSWSQDSKHLFLAMADSKHRNGLYVLSLETGDLRELTSLAPLTGSDTYPALSPDGRILAFRRGRKQSIGDLYLMSLGNDFSPQGAPRLLVPKIASGGAWTADGKELVFSSGAAFPAATMKRVAVSGAPGPQPVALAGSGTYSPAISRPAGNGVSRLAWAHRFSDANIYRLNIGQLGLSSQSQRAAEPQPLIASSFRDAFPQYSPDGKSLVFYSARSGGLEIWICQADGSSPRQLTSLGAVVTASPRWSPDGKQIAFDSDKEGAFEVYVVSAEGGSPRRMTDKPSASFTSYWSLDGRWIYFTSNRGGALDVWKMPSSGGAAEQVTRKGGVAPTMSPDGRFLYYVKDIGGNEAGLWRAPVDGGDETQMITRIYRYSYAVTKRGIYYSVPQSSDSGGTIEFLDPDTGKHSILARTDKSLDLGLAVSPDGRDLLYPQIDYEGSNLMMIENFR